MQKFLSAVIGLSVFLVTFISSCTGVPSEVENAVGEANLDCPVNLFVAQVESVEIEDQNIVYTVSCGQTIRNLVLQSPEKAAIAIIGVLKSTAGAGFHKVTEVAQEFDFNIMVRIEDNRDDFDPIEVTLTPEEVADIDTGNLQLNLFR